MQFCKNFTLIAPKCRSHDKHQITKCKRSFIAVTEFCKLVIFCVKMGLSDNFTERAPKCRSDDKHYKSSTEG